ncbi:helix-turn-helix domain-containing protein [Erwinia sp. BNK-24-b]|uniref:helix-turn-helix domain-containing protein n=1 Tax=Erwinia TaxID=551 RepID=UPI001FF046F1|nr:helix-turn-helix domain-containing protein [Erwinia phyllosphaerae]MBV4367236.1 LuxR family transcriptional regulator [Erwinia phyllosphaerae]
MSLYVISDDVYFLAGMRYFLSANNIMMRDYSYEKWLAEFCPGNLIKGDVVIIDINFKNCHTKLGMAKNIDYFGINVAFIIDLPLQGEHTGFHPYWLISKKSALKKFIPLFKGSADGITSHCSPLSRKESLIMKELSSGNSAILISRKLNVSVKTISSHKQSAVRKLGMTRINDMSLVCYKEILNLYSGFNNSYADFRYPAVPNFPHPL